MPKNDPVTPSDELYRYLMMFVKLMRAKATTALLDGKHDEKQRYRHMIEAAEIIHRNLVAEHPTVLADRLQKLLDEENEK